MHPHEPLSDHFRLSAPHAAALRRLHIQTVEDLLRHFPVRYERGGSSGNTGHLSPGARVTLVGTLSDLKARKLWKSRRNATEGWFHDTAGKVKVMWFNQPYIASYLPKSGFLKLTGTVGGSVEKPYIANPEVTPLPEGVPAESGLFAEDAEAPDTLFPVYPETAGLTSRWIYHALERIFAAGTHRTLRDPLPVSLRTRYHLPDLGNALLAIHRPEKEPHAMAARKRFSFEEIFVLQVLRAKERAENDALGTFSIEEAETHAENFLASLDYAPTGAQRRAIAEILSDFKKPHAMARLLEGDVGSGKTLVAAAVSSAVVHARPPGRKSGTLQVAYMAPTEILAKQHFESFISYFSHLPISIGLLTGSGCKKFPAKSGKEPATTISRTQLLSWVKNGEIALLVGTHALVQKSVVFKNLALAIVDEQHRFGTAQRKALVGKASILPHFLSMTATPIPRTLALTIYGDLDISLLDELPPGRQRVQTHLVKNDTGREAMYERMRKELALGRQAYVICPRIDEPDPEKQNALQAKSVKAEMKRLQKEVFPEYAVGLLHGGMLPREKDASMRAFEKNETQILVATSVVEVGVNVANASVILIEGAERFGLAQLHQLRGRVQRSSHIPLCFLLPETRGETSMKRLRALEASSDGFALAETDLALRGPGDLFGGTQWGVSDLGMEALKNVPLIQAARTEAHNLLREDPSLEKNTTLKERVAHTRDLLHRE
jgi:ATP-dependent DNA helicase RecG